MILFLLIQRRVDVSQRISGLALSPQAKRVAVEARGEIFDIPVKEGASFNLTNSSGSFDRHPAWSPDGKNLPIGATGAASTKCICGALMARAENAN